jgi:GNAT superfamily N-acetyltransferase
MERKWSIREYKEGDEEGILELCKAVYPSRSYDREQWMRWWHWMYKENPVGLGKIWVADDNGKIVGHHPLVFMMLKAGNQLVKASYMIDRMTHPDYRHQGMASKVQKRALNEAEREGVWVSLGTPNEAAYLVDRKTGYLGVARKQIVLKPLNWGNSLKMRTSNRFLIILGAVLGKLLTKIMFGGKRAPVIQGLTIAQVPSFDERINELWARVSDRYKIIVLRDKENLNWRYCTVPDVNYSIYTAEKAGGICGYIVFRCMQEGHTKTGVIFDILAESEPIFHCLISKAVEQCQREKVDAIYGIMIVDKTLIRAFEKNGFICLPFLRNGWFELYSSSPPVSKAFLREPKNWFVQIGDSDKI